MVSWHTKSITLKIILEKILNVSSMMQCDLWKMPEKIMEEFMYIVFRVFLEALQFA